jgi:hypothetical protein
MSNGMDQGTARRRARELGGIALSARPKNSERGGWLIGGWGQANDVWIVVSLDKKEVLDDGESQSPDDLQEGQEQPN